MSEHYKILTASTRPELEVKVENLWKKGFRPTGGVAVIRKEPANIDAHLWSQAMKKRESFIKMDSSAVTFLDGEPVPLPESPTS